MLVEIYFQVESESSLSFSATLQLYAGTFSPRGRATELRTSMVLLIAFLSSLTDVASKLRLNKMLHKRRINADLMG